MREYQTLLDGAVGTPPPSTVDIDGIVLAGRRADRARATGLAAVTGVLAAGVLLGATFLVTARGPAAPGIQAGGGIPAGTGSVTTAPASPSRSVTTAHATPRGVPVGPATPDWPDAVGSSDSVPRFDRLTQTRLTAALREHLSKFTGSVAAKQDLTHIGFEYESGIGYTAKVLVSDPAGERYGWLLVRVSAIDTVICLPAPPGAYVPASDTPGTDTPGTDTPGAGTPGAGTSPYQPPSGTGSTGAGMPVSTDGGCRPDIGPHGETIYRWTASTGGRPPGIGFNTVVQHADGTQVSLYAVGAEGTGEVNGRLPIPLGTTWLIDIGTDPRLYLGS